VAKLVVHEYKDEEKTLRVCVEEGRLGSLLGVGVCGESSYLSDAQHVKAKVHAGYYIYTPAAA